MKEGWRKAGKKSCQPVCSRTESREKCKEKGLGAIGGRKGDLPRERGHGDQKR